MIEYLDVDDPADPRLADYRDLRDVQLRTHLEATHGLFIAEGEKVVRRALRAGLRLRSVMLSPRWLAALEPDLERAAAAEPAVPCYVVSESLAEAVTGFHVHRGALAAVHRPAPTTPAEVIAGARRLVVLEDIVDHTNLGAIFRTAAGLGFGGVLLSPRCADPLYRRAIKVGMGAVFAMPWARLPDWHDALPQLHRAGFSTVALTLSDDAVDISEAAAGAERLALVLGTEGHGLSARWERAAGQRARIPMRRGVDSLNVAAATAIACYLAGIPVDAELSPRGPTGH
ncbi:MAG: TrmH family RNA methyltransferase [Nocardioides sp.]